MFIRMKFRSADAYRFLVCWLLPSPFEEDEENLSLSSARVLEKDEVLNRDALSESFLLLLYLRDEEDELAWAGETLWSAVCISSRAEECLASCTWLGKEDMIDDECVMFLGVYGKVC
jgi:hypothetical protein